MRLSIGDTVYGYYIGTRVRFVVSPENIGAIDAAIRMGIKFERDIKIDFSASIEFGTGWTCCIGKETHVIVFDNGHRWAVCTRCANQYTGPVYSLAIFAPEHFVFSYKYWDALKKNTIDWWLHKYN